MSCKHVLTGLAKDTGLPRPFFRNTQILGIEGNQSITLYTVKQQGELYVYTMCLYNKWMAISWYNVSKSNRGT